MFAYYAMWITYFSDKIPPLVNATSLPLDESALSVFDLLKKELEREVHSNPLMKANRLWLNVMHQKFVSLQH